MSLIKAVAWAVKNRALIGQISGAVKEVDPKAWKDGWKTSEGQLGIFLQVLNAYALVHGYLPPEVAAITAAALGIAWMGFRTWLKVKRPDIVIPEVSVPEPKLPPATATATVQVK